MELFNDNGVLNLGEAIVEQAVKDYKHGMKVLYKKCGTMDLNNSSVMICLSLPTMKHTNSAVNFFKKDPYGIFANTTPQRIFEALNEQIIKELEEKEAEKCKKTS